MLTSNAKKLMAAAFLFPPAGQKTDYLIPIRDTDGNRYNARLSDGVWPAINYDGYNYGIKAGSGTTAPTEDDYKLESFLADIVDNIIVFRTSGNVMITRGYTNDTPYITFSITVTNTSANAVTISEIGMFGWAAVSIAGTASMTTVMLDRTLLDTPVTIPAGDTGLVTYTISGIWNE